VSNQTQYLSESIKCLCAILLHPTLKEKENDITTAKKNTPEIFAVDGERHRLFKHGLKQWYHHGGRFAFI